MDFKIPMVEGFSSNFISFCVDKRAYYDYIITVIIEYTATILLLERTHEMSWKH